MVAEFVRKHGTFPKRNGAGPDEALAQKALAKMRKQVRKGNLDPAACVIMDEQCPPGWTDGSTCRLERVWQLGLEGLILWMEAHQRPPHNASGDSTERRLAGWVIRNRRQKYREKYPERIKELDKKAPGWDAPAVWVPK